MYLLCMALKFKMDEKYSLTWNKYSLASLNCLQNSKTYAMMQRTINSNFTYAISNFNVFIYAYVFIYAWGNFNVFIYAYWLLFKYLFTEMRRLMHMREVYEFKFIHVIVFSTYKHTHFGLWLWLKYYLWKGMHAYEDLCTTYNYQNSKLSSIKK